MDEKSCEALLKHAANGLGSERMAA